MLSLPSPATADSEGGLFLPPGNGSASDISVGDREGTPLSSQGTHSPPAPETGRWAALARGSLPHPPGPGGLPGPVGRGSLPPPPHISFSASGNPVSPIGQHHRGPITASSAPDKPSR